MLDKDSIDIKYGTDSQYGHVLDTINRQYPRMGIRGHYLQDSMHIKYQTVLIELLRGISMYDIRNIAQNQGQYQ